MLSQDNLKEHLSYSPETGIFRWKRTGKIAGCKRKDGYIVLRFSYKLYLAHRLAWLYVYGEMPSRIIDHLDRNPSNNAIENLRDTTHSENHLNTGLQDNNTSGYRGIDWMPKLGKYRVRKCNLHLGVFRNLEDAINAYNRS